METNTAKKYEYAGIQMPRELKTQVRVLAAENGTSLAKMSTKLIELGLTEYRASRISGQERELVDYIEALG